MYEYGEPQWNDIVRGKTKKRRKLERACPSANLSTTNTK
jgi:hypothetical protein